MRLYEEWKHLMNHQTEETVDSFWERYSDAETRIYSDILEKKDPSITGVFNELADYYKTELVIFMGFLDGINSSLKESLDLNSVDPETPLSLLIDYPTLYFNMHKAGADYLFTLPQWKEILSDKERQEIEADYRRSKTVVKEKTPGRNDPCPCGSGKKYKKCCGAS